MLRLYTKVAVLTGGTTVLTTTVARRFLDEGAAVAMLGRDPGGFQLATELGDRAVYLPCDVACDDEVSRAFDAVVGQLGRIDILVNSGTAADDRTSSRRCTEHVIRHLRATGAGSIVNISGNQGQVGADPDPSWVPTSSSIGTTTPIDAISYAPDNIRVNDICPRFTSRRDRHEGHSLHAHQGGRLTWSGYPLARRESREATTIARPDDLSRYRCQPLPAGYGAPGC